MAALNRAGPSNGGRTGSRPMAADLGVEADEVLRVLDEHVRDLREELAALPPRGCPQERS